MASVNQNVLLYLNTISRSITYQQSTKNIDDKYWETTIIPLLYPLWHSDRDKLEVFSAFVDGTYHVTRNKYVRNYIEKTGKWVSYEFELADLDPAAAEDLRDKLIDAYLQYKENLEMNIEAAMEREFVHNIELNWIKIRLIRNFLLEECDYIFQPDYECELGELELWKKYRKHLRDLTDKGWGSPYDVKFPISPTEYLARIDQVIDENLVDRDGKPFGDMGRSDEYLTNDDYHFWQPTVNTLQNWNQRMALYMALKVRTVPNAALADVYTRKVTRRFPSAKGLDMETTSSYIDSLLEAIESGNV